MIRVSISGLRKPLHCRRAPALAATGLLGLAVVLALLGCAPVPQKDREFLSDPIMQRQDDALERGLEAHDFPRREGSAGGGSGSGGGCGC